MQIKTFKIFIAEMIKYNLNEGSDRDYQRMLHTGELPSQKIAKPVKSSVVKSYPVKSYDNLHHHVSKIKNVEKKNDNYVLHYATSSEKPKQILKASGWEHHSGDMGGIGINHKVVFKHPDGHTATFDPKRRMLSFKKSE